MPGKQVKDWDLYHKLIKEGHSKESAARIANSVSARLAKRKRKKRGGQ